MQTNKLTKDLYNNKVYGNKGNKDVIDQIHDKSKTILDVGCGAGDNARILKSLNKFVTAITISKNESELVKGICDDCCKY